MTLLTETEVTGAIGVDGNVAHNIDLDREYEL